MVTADDSVSASLRSDGLAGAFELPFAKLHGAGNGYVVLDGRDLNADWQSIAPRITDPNFGVGSDGLAVVESSDAAAVRMRIFNSDGSEAEMSGNGIRLFAKFVLDRGLASLDEGSLLVETGGGLRRVFPMPATPTTGPMTAASVAMDEPRFELAALPADPRLAGGADRLIDFELEVAGQPVVFTALSLGNPHAVIRIDHDPADYPLARIAPEIQAHPLFPQRINVEVVQVLGRDRLRARVYERGEGETLASGTGATACAVTARFHQQTDAAVAVELPGGVLHVEWPGPGESAWLNGPAVEVFEGIWREPAGGSSREHE